MSSFYFLHKVFPCFCLPLYFSYAKVEGLMTEVLSPPPIFSNFFVHTTVLRMYFC